MQLRVMKTKNDTGYTCCITGTYRCSSCTMVEREIEDGRTLPVCPFCHTAVTWVLVNETPALTH